MEERVVERVVERVSDRMDGRIDAVEERLKDHIRESVHDLESKVITQFQQMGSATSGDAHATRRSPMSACWASACGPRRIAFRLYERGDTGPRKA